MLSLLVLTCVLNLQQLSSALRFSVPKLSAHTPPAEPTLASTLQDPVTYLPLGDSITEITCWRSLLWSLLQEQNSTATSTATTSPILPLLLPPPPSSPQTPASLQPSSPFHSSKLPPLSFTGTLTTQSPLSCPNSALYPRHHEGHSGILATAIASSSSPALLPTWLAAAASRLSGGRPVDLATLLLGTNDVLSGLHSARAILGALSVLLRQLRAHNPAVQVLVARLPPFLHEDAAVLDRLRELNEGMEAWAGEERRKGKWEGEGKGKGKGKGKEEARGGGGGGGGGGGKGKGGGEGGLWLVDMYADFDPVADLRDGLHPNLRGDAKIAARWAPAVREAVARVVQGREERWGGEGEEEVVEEVEEVVEEVKGKGNGKGAGGGRLLRQGT